MMMMMMMMMMCGQYLDLFSFSFCCSEDHVRDILRKSYGDELLSGLGPNTVLNVPDGT